MTAEAAGATTRTATVLFTDLAGSTALFSRVGETAADRLRDRHFSCMGAVVELHNGRVVKNTGDGLMVAFDSATDGVRCAAQMQRTAEEERRRRPAEPLEIRVGLSIGEVDARYGDLFGTSVVEASRLCAAATPGEVLAADTVRLMAGSRAGLEFESVGALELKGLPAPLPVSRVRWEPAHREVVRCVLADDAVLIREGIARLLEESGIEVSGQAADPDELRRCVRSVRPDVVITDVRMPPTHDLEGLEVAEEIRREQPGVSVILLSQHLEARYALRLVSGGGRGIGYLLKERVTDLDDFVAAVRRVAAGGAAIDPEVVGGLVSRERARGALPTEELGPLARLAEGKTDDAEARTVLERLPVGDAAREDPVRAALELLAGCAEARL
jgi:serine/threonine-protein kinase